MAEPAAALHAVFGADISPLTKKLDDAAKIAAAKAGQMQREFERSGKGAEDFGRRAAKSIEATSPAVEGLGKRMAGTEKAIGGATAALDLLGAKGSPAVKGLASAVAGLATTGFNPLGIAIGASVALLSAWGGGAASASEKADELTKSLASSRAEFSRLLSEVEADGGPQVGSSAADRLRGRLDRMRELSDMAASFQRNNPRADPVQSLGLTTDLAAFGATSLAELRSKINTAAGYLEQADRESYARMLRARLPLDLEYERQRNEEVRALLAANRPAGRPAFSDLEFAIADMRGGSGEIVPGKGWDATAGLRADLQKTFETTASATDALEQFRREAALLRAGPAAPLMDPSAMTFRESVTRTDYRGDAIKGSDALEGFRARMSQIKDGLMTVGQLGASTADSLSESFSGAFEDFAMGTKTASQAMKAFAASFLSDIARMLARQLALNALTSGASALGLSWGGGGEVVSENLGGIGAAKAPTSQARSAMVVNSTVINSAPGTTARTEVAQGPGGPELRTFVEAVVSSDAERGGPISRTLERTHGITRRGRR